MRIFSISGPNWFIIAQFTRTKKIPPLENYIWLHWEFSWVLYDEGLLKQVMLWFISGFDIFLNLSFAHLGLVFDQV